MYHIDLNADMGESFGPYSLGNDAALIPLVTSANVACGFHAGDPRVMEATVRQAAFHGTAVGAHPGFRDLEGFGRRPLPTPPGEIETHVLYQIGALSAFCQRQGVALQHVKVHGALYTEAAKNPKIARAIVEATASLQARLILVVPPGSALEAAGAEAGLPLAREGFIDRAYRPDGSLVPREEPGALLDHPDRAAERAVRMVKEKRVQSEDGIWVDLPADTLCVHGDNPRAEDILKAVRALFESEGIQAAPMAEILRFAT